MTSSRDSHPNAPALAGAILSEGGQSMPDLWRIVHSNANLCVRFIKSGRTNREVTIAELIGEAQDKIRSQFQSLEAQAWIKLCTAAGNTQIGAAMVSWCMNATPAQVWAAWKELERSMPFDEIFFLAARNMNQEFLFVERKLSAYVSHYYADRLKMYVSLAAHPNEIECNMTPAQLSSLPRELADFLAHPAVNIVGRV
ncbi:hypothetical protein [Advenella incenata]|nr:hypothetical protein [Advenella incenata]